MNDKSDFHLSGCVNEQNSPFWGTKNPREMHEQPLHSIKATGVALEMRK